MHVQVSCVSGAQLSNYATFLVHPEQAALSIVLTALSTAAGVVVTPLLVLLLLGQHIPVDVQGMAASIMQIVILPVGIGMACLTQPKPRNAHCLIPNVDLTMGFTSLSLHCCLLVLLLAGIGLPTRKLLASHVFAAQSCQAIHAFD